MPRRASFLALCLLVMIVTGCGATPKPVVEVASVGISSRSEDAAVLVFQLDVHSSTEQPLSLREVRYTASLDGRVVFRGTRFAETTATHDRAHTIDLPIPVRADQAQWPLEGQREYRITGSVAYLRPGPVGEMLYDLGLKRKRVRFGESGALDFESGGQQAQPDQSDESSADETTDSAG